MSDPLETDPLRDWPDRNPLVDENGQVVMVFSPSESTHGAIPWADGVWVPSTVPTHRAVGLALHAMAGWRFSTSDPTLAKELLEAGAAERRHAHTMSRTPLGTAPPPPAGSVVRVEPLTAAQVDRHALALATLTIRAYPPTHPDAFDGDGAAAVSQVRAIARGEMLGLLMTESRVALIDHQVVGACLVVDRAGRPPHGGPWVIDIFRDPDCPVPGIGTALLGEVIRAGLTSGLPGLSLAVSHANQRARRLYTRLGFAQADESWTLALPGEDERPGFSGSGSKSRV